MAYYQVIRSPDYLEHHGIPGMKWGVWNEETRARRTGSHKRAHKDYSKMSDKKLKRELDRRKRIKELNQLDAEDDLKRNPIHITKERMKMIGGLIASIGAVTTAVIATRNKLPGALKAADEIIDMGKQFVDMQFINPMRYGRNMKWVL